MNSEFFFSERHISYASFLFPCTWRVGEITQSCPALWDPKDFSVHGILQARILEWVAISFSRGSTRPRDRTRVSRIGGRRFNLRATREALHLKCWVIWTEKGNRQSLYSFTAGFDWHFCVTLLCPWRSLCLLPIPERTLLRSPGPFTDASILP